MAYVMAGLSILLSICTNCAQKSPGNIVDPELNVYVAKFEWLAWQFGRPVQADLSVTFVNKLPGNWVGVCYLGYRQINILRGWWQFADDLQREVLMLHELGHCVLGKSHDITFVDNRPRSIMYPSVLWSYQYGTFREEYLQEYFGHARVY